MNHPRTPACNLCYDILDCTVGDDKKITLRGGISLTEEYPHDKDLAFFTVGNKLESNMHLCSNCIRMLKVVLADVEPDAL